MKVRKDGVQETLPVSAASLPLPTGAATSANQLPDGHNVTVDNAAGASAVNIQDGGNSITVDGTVTTTPSGVQEIEGDEAEGSGVLPQPILIGGDDGTDVKNINVDAITGDVQVDITHDIDINDISKGTQTNDVKITLDGEEPTVNLGATDNAVLDSINTNTTDLPNVIGTDGAVGPTKAVSVAGTESGGNLQELRVDADGHAQIDVLSNALPTGAATETTLDAIKTAVEILDNVVSGSEAQVDIVGALPAGTAYIGKTRRTDGTYDANIGPLSSATGVATASGDTTILAVGAGNKVLVYALSFVPTTASTADVDVKIIIGTTDKVQWRTNTNGGGYAESSKNDQWLYEGADGEDVKINLSGADSVAWNLKYLVVAV